MKELIIKIAKAKKEIGKISKDSTNPFYKSKYFDINQLLKHVETVLQNHNLLILQPITDNSVCSQIYDIESGIKIESCISLPQITDPQKLGSAITYYRRYTLQSLLSLQAEDDDANATVKSKSQPTKTDDDNKAWLNVYTSKDKKEITKEFKDCHAAINDGSYTLADIRKKYKVSKAVASDLENSNFFTNDLPFD